MLKRLFYTSPVDHHTLGEWPQLAASLGAAIEKCCGGDVTVETGEEPVFGVDGDVEETLAGLAEVSLSRRVRVDLWSSVAHYGVICLTLGSDIKRPERRALERRLTKKTLKGEALLRTVDGPWSDEVGQVYGYRMSGDDAAARADLEHMLFPFDPTFYLGERWLLQDEQEKIDPAYDGVHEVAPGLVTFLATDGEAEEKVWQRCFSGEGLLACFPDDPALGVLASRFHERRDLRILLAEKPDAGMRVTLGRCHPDDSLVVAYTPPEPPEIEAPILFML